VGSGWGVNDPGSGTTAGYSTIQLNRAAIHMDFHVAGRSWTGSGTEACSLGVVLGSVNPWTKFVLDRDFSQFLAVGCVFVIVGCRTTALTTVGTQQCCSSVCNRCTAPVYYTSSRNYICMKGAIVYKNPKAHLTKQIV